MNTGKGSGNGYREKRWILLVDDHPLIRERLAGLINREPDLIVCGEAEDVRSAWQAVDELRPDVTLVDLQLKDGGYGIDLVKELRDRHPELATLVVSMHNEVAYAEESIRAGAYGYLTKRDASERVVEAIRSVLRRHLYISEPLAAMLVARMAGTGGVGQGTPAERLTAREFEVFQLLGEGVPVRDIAARLRISAKTVEAHRAHIKEKLKLHTGRELVCYAVHSASHAGGPDLLRDDRAAALDVPLAAGWTSAAAGSTADS